ncbi:MAG: hypothetical protein R3Y57_03470 [Erysipelotrichaceae bacterium]
MICYILASISVIGLSITLMINGYLFASFVLGIMTILYLGYKFHKCIHEFDCLKVALYTLVLWGIWLMGGLIFILPTFLLLAIVIGLYMLGFEKMMLHCNQETFIATEKYVYLLALVGMMFILVTLWMPIEYISGFLYPYFINGGAKQAILAIMLIIFAPYPLLIQTYKYSQNNCNYKIKKI